MTTRPSIAATFLLALVLASAAGCGDDDTASRDDSGNAEIEFGGRTGVPSDEVVLEFVDQSDGLVSIEVVNNWSQAVAVGGSESFRDEDADPWLLVSSFMLLDEPDDGADAPDFDRGTYVAAGDRHRLDVSSRGEVAARFCYEVVGSDAFSGSSDASTGDSVRLVGSTEDYTRRLACGTLPAT